MRNQCITILLFIFFGALTLNAQISDAIYVVESNKGIRTTTASKKRIKSKAGTALEYGAKLRLRKNQEIILYMNGDFVKLQGKGKYNLVKKEDDLNDARSLNFDPLFAEFIKASYDLAFNCIVSDKVSFKSNKNRGDAWGTKEDLMRSGWGDKPPPDRGGWGTKPPPDRGGWGIKDAPVRAGWGAKPPPDRGGWGAKPPPDRGGWGDKPPPDRGGWGEKPPPDRGGWGDKPPPDRGGWGKDDQTIVPISPGGTYLKKLNTIHWMKEVDVDTHKICVFDENLNIIFDRVTTNDHIQIDMTGYDPNMVYYWQLFAKNKRAISPAVNFKVLDDEDIELVTLNCENSDLYCETNSEALKGLMEAVAYENGEMYLDACDTYQKLIKKYPKNNLLRMSFAAYYLRLGQYKLANLQYNAMK